MVGPLLVAAVTAFAAAQYAIGRPVAPEAWLAIAPLLASLALRPLRTALLREVPRSVAAARLASRYLSAAGRFFRVDEQVQALSRPDLQAAADELLGRLPAHTRRRLDHDVAVLLAELTLTDPGLQPAAPGQRPAAGATVRAA